MFGIVFVGQTEKNPEKGGKILTHKYTFHIFHNESKRKSF